MRYYDRYQEFLLNGKQTVVPYVTIPPKPTDKKFIYKVGQSRLDKLSQEFYDTPYFGWLILMSNPQYGGLENNISNGAVLIIPYPLVNTLQDYKKALDTHFFYYGR
tara:strand:+ start:3136 stop:3453 length:318 start_codon:yes stop_codon:yes gene_type:complete